MTVTPLSSRTSSATTPRRTVARQRRVSTGAEASGLTISFEITLDGESRYSDAVRILDTLRLVTDRLDTATLEIAPTSSADEPYAGPLPAGATLRALSSVSEPSLDTAEAEGRLHRPETAAWPDATDTRTGHRVEIMPDTRSVAVAGEQISLTRVEFDLLIFLAEHPRRVFDRPQLLRNVWGYEHTGLRTVDVHIRRLRAKLGDDLVTTVRSVGYRLSDKANTHITRSF